MLNEDTIQSNIRLKTNLKMSVKKGMDLVVTLSRICFKTIPQV